MSTLTHDPHIQRMQALQIANNHRTEMARLRAHIHALPPREGREMVCGILLDLLDPGAEGSMPVGRLLLAIQRVGVHRSSRWLRRAGVLSADRRVDELTARQREALVAAIRQSNNEEGVQGA